MRAARSPWNDCWTSGRRGVCMAASSYSSSNCLWKTPTAPKQKVNAYCWSCVFCFWIGACFTGNTARSWALGLFIWVVARAGCGDSSGLRWEIWFSLNPWFWFAGVLSCALWLAVSLTGRDGWCCSCRQNAPGLPFGVIASQSCGELLCPSLVKCPTLHLRDWVIRMSYSVLLVLSSSY